MGLVVAIHIIVCLLLMMVVLMQAGRGGGLTESLSSAESIFGSQTNTFMVKATSIFATIFFLTSVGLAVYSAKKGQSLMIQQKSVEQDPSKAIDQLLESATPMNLELPSGNTDSSVPLEMPALDESTDVNTDVNSVPALEPAGEAQTQPVGTTTP